MRISTDARTTDIQPAINWISGLMGGALDKRVSAFEQQERSNPLLAAYFHENFALEFALASARKYRRSTGRLPKGAEYDQLYGFLIPAQRIHAALPASAKAPFEGRLRHALNAPHGLRSFAYEISIATHLMQRNWDVVFMDYSGAARFDLLARQSTAEVEVECKTTSGDTGRKIHRQEVNRLADLILPTTKRLADTAGCHRLLVTIPNRLGKSTDELARIAATVAAAAQQRTSASSDVGRVDYMFENVGSWPEPGPGRDHDAIAFFEERFGIKNSNLLFLGRARFSIVAVMITSSKADTVVDTIADEAKEAADQCSGTRPALITLHLVDQISRSDLQTMLKTPSGLHEIAHAVFKDTGRLHVDSIAFTVPQILRTDGHGAKWLSGDMVAIYNPQPRFPCAEIRSIFRAAKR